MRDTIFANRLIKLLPNLRTLVYPGISRFLCYIFHDILLCDKDECCMRHCEKHNFCKSTNQIGAEFTHQMPNLRIYPNTFRFSCDISCVYDILRGMYCSERIFNILLVYLSYFYFVYILSDEHEYESLFICETPLVKDATFTNQLIIKLLSNSRTPVYIWGVYLAQEVDEGSREPGARRVYAARLIALG